MSNDDIVAPLLDSAADFLAGRHSPARCKTAVGLAGPVDAAMWRGMAEVGWTALMLPEALGGSGLSLSTAAALCELFGRELVPEPLIAASVMPTAILAAAESALAAQLAGALVSGEHLLTLAWQARAGQLDPETPCVRLQDGRLSGRSLFVPVADDNAILLVWADAGGAPALAAVRADAMGVARQAQAAGLTTLSTVSFDGAAILAGKPVLQGAAAETALRAALTAGSVCAAAQLAGLAAGALQKTLDYVGNRVQFGRPIGSFQSIQHRCADLYIATRLSRAAWREAACRPSPAAVAAAKARCGDTAFKVGREAVQLHGAMGFTEEADIGLYLRAALHFSSWLGAPALQRRRFMSACMTTEGESVHA
jgi:alkylation response protein AidB-like acyl-CoA dehydrogenase